MVIQKIFLNWTVEYFGQANRWPPCSLKRPVTKIQNIKLCTIRDNNVQQHALFLHQARKKLI